MRRIGVSKIKGVINPDGSIRMGKGFRCQKAGVGIYVIEFDISLEDPPIAVCTLTDQSEAINHKTVSIISLSVGQIVCATASLAAPENLGFKFIAISHGQPSQSDVNENNSN